MPEHKLRVAIVVPSLVDGGGIPAMAFFLYSELAATGQYSIDLISLPSSRTDSVSSRLLFPLSWLSGPTVSTGIWRGLPYRHVGANLVELEPQRYRPREQLTEVLGKYDLVQFVSGTPSWALAAGGCGKPVCLATATMTAVERKSRLDAERGWKRVWVQMMTWVTARLDHRAIRKVQAIFVINHWMEAYLKEQTGAPPVIFAPPGVDTDFFRPTAYQPSGPILCVGRLEDPRKNVALLFRAYSILLRTMADVPDLVLAGKTMPGRAEMELAEELDIRDRIQLRPNMSGEGLRELYQSAGLFVLSSDEEGLGIVILEAMASGLPVVATRCGGPETAVLQGKTGLLTPMGDEVALAGAMGELLRDPARRERMGIEGRRVAETSFSLSVTILPYLEFYERLLSGRGG